MPTFIRVVTLFIQVVSGFTTWMGFREVMRHSQGSFSRDFIPVVMALASSILATCLWFALFAYYPNAKRDERRKLNLAIVLGCSVIFGLSTLWSVMGLGGNAAVNHHMSKSVAVADQTLTQLATGVEREQTLATSTELLAKQFENLAQLEANGAFSTYSGRGEVVIQLESMAQTLGNIHDRIGATISDRRRTIEDAKKEITSLREIVGNSDLAMDAKVRKFAAKLTTLNQLFSQITSGTSLELVADVSKSLDKLAATQAPTSGSQVGEAQTQALGRLGETIASAQKVLRDATEAVALTATDEVKPLAPIDAANAILRYCYVIIPSWAGALALDYFPLLFVFILFWTRESREEEEKRKIEREVHHQTREVKREDAALRQARSEVGQD